MASDVVQPSYQIEGAEFQQLDVTKTKKFNDLVDTVRPTKLIHLAAILSATAEKNP